MFSLGLLCAEGGGTEHINDSAQKDPGDPLPKLYDVLDPVVVRSARGGDPIAANYTAALAALVSRGRKVANSAAQAFLRPDNPRFGTGIYLIHPYDRDKIPILFIHGLISSPFSWQNLTNDLCSDPKILERILQENLTRQKPIDRLHRQVDDQTATIRPAASFPNHRANRFMANAKRPRPMACVNNRG